MSSRIAIIPARGGSKRIPRKNIREFAGKPMIAWSIEAALRTGCFDQVLVSTDDPEIAEVSMRFGAAVPFMRRQHHDDHAPASLATIDALEQAETHWNRRFSTVVQLMPNCPLRTSDDIQAALREFEESHVGFQVSCFKFGWMNPWWARTLNGAGEPTILFPQAAGQRSQDLPELYCPTGAIWIAARDGLLLERSFYGRGHRFCKMPWMSAVDIDDEDDFRMAQALHGMLEGHR